MMKQVFTLMLTITAAIGLAQTPSGLNVNDMAPGFSVADQNGKTVSLEKQLAKGPVVLLFYRGFWCPYCNKQLKALEDSLVQITAKGATLIAVTPEKPESIAKTAAKTGATYPILFDDGLAIMNAYRVAFEMDTATVTRYRKYGIDMNENNGRNGANLPVPAVYIIKPGGKIGWRFFDVNYTKRPTVKEILENL